MDRNSFEIQKRAEQNRRKTEGAKPDTSDVPDDGKIRPLFYWKCPPFEEFRYWFGPYADIEFRQDHPVFYIVLSAIMIALLVLPILLYYKVFTSMFGTDAGKESYAGFFGSFLIAIGLINIAAAWQRQYFGHIVTLVCLIGGAILIGLSFALAA